MSNAAATMIPPGVTVFCDPPLRGAMRALDGISRAQAGAPVAVLCAPAASMLAQIQRHTRNDVLFTLSSAMDMAVALQLVRPETRIDGFSNPLVLTCLHGRASAPADQAGLAAMLGAAKLAVTDNTVASGLDGRAILDRNGLTKAAGDRAMGAATTADVAFLVTTGAADIGLVYLTDVRADPRLMVLATLAADPVLTSVAGAVNAKAVSPNAQAVLNVMRGAQGSAALRNAGLTVVS
jgi:molybdate transport system substrate-binding protein